MLFESVIGQKHIHFEQVDSTNAEAKRLLQAKNSLHGTVVTADFQTQGRGQYGRSWNSAEHQNIIMSVILHPEFLKVSEQFYLNIAFSMSVAIAVKQYCEQVKVKWPNDIYIQNSKVAGVLIENFIQGERITSSIIGIGLNVFQKQWPADVPNATSVSLHSDTHPDRGQLQKELFREMNRALFRLQFDKANLRQEYLTELYKLEEYSKFIARTNPISGIIKGIDEIGRLILEQNGVQNAYSHDEIKMIIE